MAPCTRIPGEGGYSPVRRTFEETVAEAKAEAIALFQEEQERLIHDFVHEAMEEAAAKLLKGMRFNQTSGESWRRAGKRRGRRA